MRLNRGSLNGLSRQSHATCTRRRRGHHAPPLSCSLCRAMAATSSRAVLGDGTHARQERTTIDVMKVPTCLSEGEKSRHHWATRQGLLPSLGRCGPTQLDKKNLRGKDQLAHGHAGPVEAGTLGCELNASRSRFSSALTPQETLGLRAIVATGHDSASLSPARCELLGP